MLGRETVTSKALPWHSIQQGFPKRQSVRFRVGYFGAVKRSRPKPYHGIPYSRGSPSVNHLDIEFDIYGRERATSKALPWYSTIVGMPRKSGHTALAYHNLT